MQPFADWCGLGVRDPSLLVDIHGRPVRLGDRFVLYFNGRDRHLTENGITRVGCARSHDLVHWEPDPAPVFEDGDYATTAGVIKVDSGLFRLYYAFDTARGFRLAQSPDGMRWSIRPEPILTPDRFRCRRIGLPFVIWYRDRWLMLIEGLRAHFAIYAAASDDGLTWQPVNDGEPIYMPGQSSWDSLAQANPSIATVPINQAGPGTGLSSLQRLLAAWRLGPWLCHFAGALREAMAAGRTSIPHARGHEVGYGAPGRCPIHRWRKSRRRPPRVLCAAVP